MTQKRGKIMENNEVNVVTQQQTDGGAPVQQTTPTVNNPTDNGNQGKPVMQPDRTFTRDEVTNILQKRLDRYRNSMYIKYGVKDSRDEALETVAFLRNNINQDKIDDIKTYFKGKGLQFTEDELKRQLESHPEWIKQAPVQNNKPKTTVTPIGTPNNGPVDRSEHDLAKKIFGDDLFD